MNTGSGRCNDLLYESAGDLFPARCQSTRGHNTSTHYVIYEAYMVRVSWPNEDYDADL